MNGMREVGWVLGACLGLLGCPGKLAPASCQEEPSIDCGQCGARAIRCGATLSLTVEGAAV
jgi:hypothetical protein